MGICGNKKRTQAEFKPNIDLTPAVIPDWRFLDLYSPFLHPIEQKYFVSVPTKYKTPGGSLLSQRLINAKPIAAKALLEVFNKNSNAINILVPHAIATEYYISERPVPDCGSPNETVESL